MSLGQDLINEGLFDAHRQEVEYERISALADRGVWRTKDSRFLKISSMSKGHLKSTIKMLLRCKGSMLCELYLDKFVAEYSKE